MTNRYAKSFHKKVRPPAGERCSLKWHYTGVMRELIGFFDEMAAIDETGERFVYTSIAYIIETAEKNCKRFNGKPYRESSIRHGLAEARARRVISKLMERERWLPSGEKGHKMLRALGGSIVVNHDCVTHFENGECTWVGPMHGCGRWERLFDTEPATQLDGEIVFDNTPSGVLYWNGCAQHGKQMLADSQAQLAAPNAGYCAGQSADAVHTTVHTTVQTLCIPCAEPLALVDSGQASDVVDVSGQNGEVSRSNRQQPVQPEKPVKPAEPKQPCEPAAQIKNQPQAGASTSPQYGGCAPKPPLTITNPQTIGQRFEGYDDEALLEEISDDEIDVHKLKCPGDAGLHGVDSGNVEMMATYVRQVIEDCKDQPWEATHAACARLMDKTIKKVKRAHKEYPPGWFFVMKRLQASPKPCRLKRPEKTSWTLVELRDARLQPGWHAPAPRVSGYDGTLVELCADGIARNAENRQAKGYTAQAADGVWDKA